MSEPITALPPTRHTNAKLNHETACDDLCKAIEESELKPLLPLLRHDIPADDSAGHLAFAKLFEIIRQQPDFEQKYYDDVPDVIKPFIEQYAFPSEQTERKSVLQNNLPHAPPKVTASNSLLGGLEKVIGSLTGLDSLPEAPLPGQSVPLPPSPHFRRFALQLAKKLAPFPDIMEGDGKPMERVPSGTEFENWGQNVKHLPSDTFVARTEVGLCNLVKWAKANGKTVRVAGYRHTWTDFFAADGQVVVMLLPLKTLTELPSYSPTLQEIQKDSDLVGIELAPRPFIDSDTTLCTIKAGTTNDMFRIWAFENKRWCLPINTIMVEMTLGGSNSPICHGSGFSTTTLSDLVAEFHYVDPDGNPKTISDPDQLRAAAGCFGLLGICTALTIKLDKMTMAVMNPVKLPLALAIPPPAGYKIPSAVDMRGITPEKLEEARLAFIKRCEEDFYLEWFWFPLTSEVWVNTWNRYDAGSFDSLHPYPSALDSIVQWCSGWLAEQLIDSWLFKHLSGRLQALAVAVPALAQMPDLPNPEDAVKTLFSEAIHFRRGIQNTRCLDSEWEIPIPEDPKTPKKRDYGLIQRAWWDAISAFYSRDDVPMRLTLEMRLTGGSNMILAPQRGNDDCGTISIEVLTLPTTPEKDWQSFMQQVADAWTSYKDSKGNLLNARPHWAKQWKGLTVHGQPIEKYLKETAYKDAIPEFGKTLGDIAVAQGTTVDAMRQRFGNPLLERLFFE